MNDGKMIRATVRTREGWSAITEVPDPPPVEMQATVSAGGPDYHGGLVPRLMECTGTFRLAGWNGKTPRYEQV